MFGVASIRVNMVYFVLCLYILVTESLLLYTSLLNGLAGSGLFWKPWIGSQCIWLGRHWSYVRCWWISKLEMYWNISVELHCVYTTALNARSLRIPSVLLFAYDLNQLLATAASWLSATSPSSSAVPDTFIHLNLASVPPLAAQYILSRKWSKDGNFLQRIC